MPPPAPNVANGWYVSDLAVTLDAPTSAPSSRANTPPTAVYGTTYGGRLHVSRGVTNVLYRSTDRAGNVEAARTLTVKLDKSAPTNTLSADPSEIWPPNGQTVNVTLSGAGADAVSGLAGVTYVVTDEYGAPLSVPARTLSGASASWADSLGVEARRNGGDTDGRLYRVRPRLRRGGHTATATADIVFCTTAEEIAAVSEPSRSDDERRRRQENPQRAAQAAASSGRRPASRSGGSNSPAVMAG